MLKTHGGNVTKLKVGLQFLNQKKGFRKLRSAIFVAIHDLKQGFSTRAIAPLWGPRSGSPGATSRGPYRIALPWYCKT